MASFNVNADLIPDHKQNPHSRHFFEYSITAKKNICLEIRLAPE